MEKCLQTKNRIFTREFFLNMKILLPYSTHFKLTESQQSGKVVTGGIEKFCYDLEKNISGIIPVCITKEDKDNRLTKKRITDAIAQHDPDMILFNNPWWGNMMMSFGLPLIAIMHEPLVRDIRMVELGNILKNLNESGAHLYFVSQVQLDFHRTMAKRIKDVDFGEIKGFVNPSYLEDTVFTSDDLLYDCATVGRCDNEKAPFLLHKKLQNSNLNSLVMTNDGVYKSDTINEYVEANQHWSDPRHTLRGLPHNEVMKNIGKAKSFVSTWPKESWGITTMEALGCGVPVILFTDDTGVHASESIAADSSHIIKLNRKCSNEEFQKAVEEFATCNQETRSMISALTKEKHSLVNWKLSIDKMIDLRYNDSNGKTKNLMEFFA